MSATLLKYIGETDRSEGLINKAIYEVLDGRTHNGKAFLDVRLTNLILQVPRGSHIPTITGVSASKFIPFTRHLTKVAEKPKNTFLITLYIETVNGNETIELTYVSELTDKEIIRYINRGDHYLIDNMRFNMNHVIWVSVKEKN